MDIHFETCIHGVVVLTLNQNYLLLECNSYFCIHSMKSKFSLNMFLYVHSLDTKALESWLFFLCASSMMRARICIIKICYFFFVPHTSVDFFHLSVQQISHATLAPFVTQCTYFRYFGVLITVNVFIIYLVIINVFGMYLAQSQFAVTLQACMHL